MNQILQNGITHENAKYGITSISNRLSTCTTFVVVLETEHFSFGYCRRGPLNVIA